MSKTSAVLEILLVFLRLGFTSFGGPVAHLGYFQKEFVGKKKWLDEAAFAELVALCQFLPGPASSQLGFSIGYLRGGFGGAVAAFIGFTLPSALVMIACGYGVAMINPQAPWIHGLKIAAVAVVAQAVWAMGYKLCPDRKRFAFACAALAAALIVTWTGIQLVLIGAGLCCGMIFLRKGYGNIPPVSAGQFAVVESKRSALISLMIFAGLFILLPLTSGFYPGQWTQGAADFYRVGSLVFGGGHVILPLLETETVGRELLSHDEFLAGYGMAQALPGPLFSFAAYLGVVMARSGPGWIGGLWCLMFVFLPGLLLILGVLPFWSNLRSSPLSQAALRGANAVVVGILAAAFIHPVWTGSVTSPGSLILAVTAFAALQFARLPAWLLVISCAICAGILNIR